MRYTDPVVTTRHFRQPGAAPVEMFAVAIRVLPGSDEMWDTFTHPAMFRNRDRAERFAARIKASRAAPDLSKWMFPVEPCSPFGPTDVAPFSPL